MYRKDGTGPKFCQGPIPAPEMWGNKPCGG